MLPPDNRLRQKRDFKRVYQRGKSLALPCFALYWHKNRANGARIGFSVSKKIGKAVTRNRLKRQCRASARVLLEDFPRGYDYIFVLRQAATKADYAQLEQEMAKLLRQMRERVKPQSAK